MRRVPELRFERDESLEHAMKIERLLAEAEMGEDRAEEEQGTGAVEEPENEDADGVEDRGE